MTLKTKNRKAINYMLRRETRQNREAAIALLARALQLPTKDEILLQYGHYPSRFHVEPIK